MGQQPGSEKLPSQLPTEFADVVSDREYDRLTTERVLGLITPEDQEKLRRYEEVQELQRTEKERKMKAAWKQKAELQKAAEGEIIDVAAKRIARAPKPEPELEPRGSLGVESATDVDVDATRREFEKQISEQVNHLRESGADWDSIVATIAENFGLDEDTIKRTVRKKEKDSVIGKKLAAVILGQATIVGDASIIDASEEQ